MGRQSDGKASRSDGKTKKPKADPSAKEVEKIAEAEDLEIDEIRVDGKIGKRLPFGPNQHKRF